MASPPGIRVPLGGSCCAVCIYIAPSGVRCRSDDYVRSAYKIGKKKGDDRFIDGKTGEVITDLEQFCCDAFDWNG